MEDKNPKPPKTDKTLYIKHEGSYLSLDDVCGVIEATEGERDALNKDLKKLRDLKRALEK